MTVRKFARAATEFITGAFIGAAIVGILILGVHRESQVAREIQPRAIAVAVKLAKHDAPVITEDDPRWNCATMGDHRCGNAIRPDAPDHCYPVELEPGVTTWLEMRRTGPAYCTAIPGA